MELSTSAAALERDRRGCLTLTRGGFSSVGVEEAVNEVDRRRFHKETGSTDDVEAGIISKEEQEEPCRDHRQRRNSHFQQSCLPVVLSLMEFNHIFNEQTIITI